MAFCDTIKLEKGMYNISGKSFTSVLEDLDPSENYKGTSLEGLDAYQRQLKRFNIKVSGRGCDKVEKFFSTPDSAILFPEFLSRAIKQGLTACDVIPEITAVNTIIDGIDYRAIKSETATATQNDATEGNALREVSVRTNSSLVSLKKYGRLFSSSYEALRFQNLDVVAVIFKKIGMDIANEQMLDAVSALVSSGSSAATEVEPETPGTLTYTDLLTLWKNFNPYRPNVMMASSTTIKEILSLPAMQDAEAGLAFHGTGNLVTPLGAKLVMVKGLEDGKIITIDSNFALQMIQSGDVIVEYDKVIDKQLERATISVTAGFSRIFRDAVKVLNYY
ncbi:MAG: phage major capsid protein [Clostridia bacterium]|nr:phage major capsid protein [Clostridia bacterium]